MTVDRSGQTSDLSAETVEDTPRPDGIVTLVTSDESVLCTGQTGTYEVHLLEQGRIDMFLLEDPCTLRAAAIYSGLEPLSP